MELCKVYGKCVSTIKNDSIKGYSLLILKKIDASGKPSREIKVAVDPIGCSEGEIVLVAKGSSARFALGQDRSPVDAVIVGIVDQYELK